VAISVVINTLNEESNIADCMASVRGLADEIVVCDMHSDDRTAEIARALGARVVYHPRTGFVEPARHYAISQASHDWVLVIDADERMTPGLKERLAEIARDDTCDLVSFCILFEYFGDFLRDGAFCANRFPRFFRKQVYLDNYDPSEEQVHQNFRMLEVRVAYKTELPPQFHLLHLAYPTIEKYVCKTVGMYARIEAEQMHERGVPFSLRKMLLQPIRAFVRSYLLRGGYRAGVRGLVKTVLYSVYRFTVWANLWFLYQPGRDQASTGESGG